MHDAELAGGFLRRIGTGRVTIPFANRTASHLLEYTISRGHMVHHPTP